jgi:hypothetical protein
MRQGILLCPNLGSYVSRVFRAFGECIENGAAAWRENLDIAVGPEAWRRPGELPPPFSLTIESVSPVRLPKSVGN